MVSFLHYIRLVYRSVLFLLLAVKYLQFRMDGGKPLLTSIENEPMIVIIVWIVFVVEMIFRLFPSKYESPGCQKQFARNYIKSGNTQIEIPDNHATMLVALIWIAFNALFGVLHSNGIFDDGIMILLCGFYAVCDMICILFFCPFQSWFMKNKCCSACRIYNWDYLMMFTPLFFVQRSYLWSLLILSLILMIRWEITFYRHPERFSESTNEYLRCKNCTERLCDHKRQLKKLRKKIETDRKKQINRLKK